MKFVKRLFWPAILGLMILISVCAVFGSMMIAPHASGGPKPDGRLRNFTLRSTDGYVIASSYWPSQRPEAPGVLLLHGVDASRASLVKQAHWLNDMGYAVLAIDFRGHGQSDQVNRSFGLYEARDARAAYEWLEARQNGAPIGVVGISMGGAAALIGEHGPLPTRCMVLQAVYPNIRSAIYNRLWATKAWPVAWAVEPLLSYQARLRFGVWPDRISPVNAMRQYKGQLFVIGGADDTYTPPDEIRALAAAAPGDKQVWIISGRDHAEITHENSARYKERVLNFFDACLGPALIPDIPPEVLAPQPEAQPSPPAQGQNP